MSLIFFRLGTQQLSFPHSRTGAFEIDLPFLLSAEQLLGFLAAAALITIAPGPDNLMVLGIGASQGRARGIAFGLGCAIGCLSHTLLAVVGVSAAIAASPTAFTLLRVAGGLYLLWLGVSALRNTSSPDAPSIRSNNQSLTRLFMQGMLANAINPKVILFFLSFLPQFIMPAHGSVPGQMAALGVVFTVQAAVLFGLLGFFAGTVGQLTRTHPRLGLWLDRMAGIVFLALGLRLIIAG